MVAHTQVPVPLTTIKTGTHTPCLSSDYDSAPSRTITKKVKAFRLSLPCLLKKRSMTCPPDPPDPVKSKRGTDFRIWARKVLKQYLVKGYAINECLSCMCEEWDGVRDGALGGLSRPQRSHRHRSRRLTANPQSRCIDSRMTCTGDPTLRR